MIEIKLLIGDKAHEVGTVYGADTIDLTNPDEAQLVAMMISDWVRTFGELDE